ncbi:MAG: DUF6046 domain-containing protein [Bacteroidales bacterium]|jgi:hypothetical protein|nr:DUF6046 domain-containing protein [Bacteroidales bacterium]
MEDPIRIINGGIGTARGDVRSRRTPAMGYSPIPVTYPKSGLEYDNTHFIVPVGLALSSEPDRVFNLPTDPRVAVSGGNSIVTREIADGDIRGTVKELWRHNDWTVTISGLLMEDEFNTLEWYMQRLVELCNARENLIVTCGLLNDTFDITRIAVTSLRFDATDGQENQIFTITAVSDDSYNLEGE